MAANDIGFATIAKECILSHNCRKNKKLVSDINGRLVLLATGRGKDKTPEGRPIVALTKLLQEVHANAPVAGIFLGGYPRPFGTKVAKYSVVSTGGGASAGSDAGAGRMSPTLMRSG